jgi:hypothetical protein
MDKPAVSTFATCICLNIFLLFRAGESCVIFVTGTISLTSLRRTSICSNMMLSDEYETRNSHVVMMNSSGKPSPNQRHIHLPQQGQQHLYDIEATSQMHSLDYNNDQDDTVLYLSANRTPTTMCTTKDRHGKQELDLKFNTMRDQENNRAAPESNGTCISSNDTNHGWFSFLYKSSNHNPLSLSTASVTESTTLDNEDIMISEYVYNDMNHETFNTSKISSTDITSDQNHHDSTIAPSSPKRRPRNYSQMIGLQQHPPLLQPQQQQNPLGMCTTTEARESTQQPQSSTRIRGDDTTMETETEYTTMSDGPKLNGHTLLPTEENYFFLRSDIAPSNEHRRCAPRQEWKMIRRDEYKTRSTTSALSSGQVTPSILYDYSDAVSVTPMPLLQQYRTKFAQLNQELLSERTSRNSVSSRYYQESYTGTSNYYHHELSEQQRDPFDDWHMQQSSLQLQEQDGDVDTASSLASSYFNANNIAVLPYQTGVQLSTVPSSNSNDHNGIVRSDTARQSSLFFCADGRMLMRLPRDRVRLLVDPDFEVGVLSVEQWRTAVLERDIEHHTDDMSDPKIHSNRDSTRLLQSNDDQQLYRSAIRRRESSLPELRYVLTVSDDLYRKIVEEMSPTNTKYFCCTRGCCNDEEKVDIRIAFFLFGTTLFILFINMLAFREH